jgi:hypothetical protein
VDKQPLADPPRGGASGSPWYFVPPFAAVALVVGAHAVIDMHGGASWSHTMIPSLVLVLQPIVLTVCHHWLRGRQASNLVRTVACAAISAVLGTLTFQLHSAPRMELGRMLMHGIPLGFLSWGFWELVYHLPLFIREANLRRLVAENARREAELTQLRASLQPHFLLNTLHAIAALTVDEPVLARRLISALGDLLRDALEASPEVRPLEADITWLRRYTDILEIRHRGALRFDWDIAAETTSVPLPKLLLQPIVENAVKHGALQRGGDGVVTLRTHFVGQALHIVVEDNGPGFVPGAKDGLGLRIVRERIGLAHPGASLHIESSPAGTRARLEIPGAVGATR